MAKMAGGYYIFNMRIDKDLLLFIKKAAMKQECTATNLVGRILEDYKKKQEKKMEKKLGKSNSTIECDD